MSEILRYNIKRFLIRSLLYLSIGGATFGVINGISEMDEPMHKDDVEELIKQHVKPECLRVD